MSYRVIENGKPQTKFGLPQGREFTTPLVAMIAAELWYSATGIVCSVWRIGLTSRECVYTSTGRLQL